MAKIGNETKLFLKLVRERAEQHAGAVCVKHGNGDYYAGTRDAINWVNQEIENVARELESK